MPRHFLHFLDLRNNLILEQMHFSKILRCIVIVVIFIVIVLAYYLLFGPEAIARRPGGDLQMELSMDDLIDGFVDARPYQ